MVPCESRKNEPIFGKALRIFLFLFFSASAVLNAVLFVLYMTEKGYQVESLEKVERYSVSLQHHAIHDAFSAIFGDVLFLSRQNELSCYLREKDPELLAKVAAEYQSFAHNHGIYDQIRFIDAEGMEMVRINFNGGDPVIVDQDQLQNKAKRYYFKDCFLLNQGEIFLSPFDLNIEHGEIEKPLKPMIRVGTPVFGPEGEKAGIVLVNYLGERLLEQVRNSSFIAAGSTMLLNSDGYYLVGPESEKEWGFMFHKPQYLLGEDDTKAWQVITHQAKGQIRTEQGVYTFEKVYPAQLEFCHSSSGAAHPLEPSQKQYSAREYCWYMVSYLSNETLDQAGKNLATKYLIIAASGLLLVLSGAWAVAFATAKRRLYQKQLKELALYDQLTRLPNRILFFDRLNMLAEHSRRYHSLFAMLYLDLDGFKEINDTHGHDVGDQLLTEVGKRLQGVCRRSDTVARLGGDEFAILYTNLRDVAELDTFARRVINELSQSVSLKAVQVRVGVSIGIALFPADSDDVETLVKQTDRAMYRSKDSGKNTYTFAQG